MNPGHLLLPILAMLAAFGPLSIDMCLPSLPAIRAELGASPGQVQLTLTTFFAGMCIGQLVYGPLSDRHGRRPMLLFGLVVYLLATLLLALAPSIGTMVAGRFLQAIGGGAMTVIARASVRDCFEGSEASRALSTLMLIMGVAPLVAPSVGALILGLAGWRAIFLVLAAWALLSLLAVVFLLPETRPPEKRSTSSLVSAFLNYGHLLGRRQVLAPALASAGAFAGMFAYISGSPFVYIELFGLEPFVYGLLFALNVVAILGGAYVNRRLVARFGPERMMTFGCSLVASAGAALLLAALLLPGSLPAIAVALFCFLSGLNLISANAIVRATEGRAHLAGTTIAVIGAGHFAVGSCAGIAVGQLHDGSALPMAAVIAACGLVSLLAERWLAVMPRARSLPP